MEHDKLVIVIQHDIPWLCGDLFIVRRQIFTQVHDLLKASVVLTGTCQMSLFQQLPQCQTSGFSFILICNWCFMPVSCFRCPVLHENDRIADVTETKKKRNSEIDMIHGPLLPAILKFAIPVMLSALLQIAFNAADTIVVGKFSGQQALAAVGATGAIINMAVSLFIGISMGANIVIATQIGSGRKERIHDSVHTSYFLAIAGGIILTLVGYFIAPLLLKAIKTPEDILDLASLYTRIYFLGSIPLLVYDFVSAILRAKGDTVRPTIYMTISGILNIILNLYTVIVLKMSVAGVAIATVVSQTLSAILVTIALCRDSSDIHLDLRKIRLDSSLSSQILRIGIPAGLQSMMWALSNIAIQSSLNTYGSVIVAGNSAGQNIESFVYISMQGFNQACITFISQNYGARDRKRIRQVFNITLLLNIAVAFLAGLVINMNGDLFMSFYTNDPEVIDAASWRLKYVVFWLFLNAALDIPASAMRGVGVANLPTVIMVGGIVGVRIAYIATVWNAMPTLPVLYLCFPVSWTITCILMFASWYRTYRKLTI